MPNDQDESGAIRMARSLNEHIRDLDGRWTLPSLIVLALLNFWGPTETLRELKTYAMKHTEQMATIRNDIARVEGSTAAAVKEASDALRRVEQLDERVRDVEQSVALHVGEAAGEISAIRSELGAASSKAAEAADRSRRNADALNGGRPK